MATAEFATQPAERHNRKRPFTSWVKRLANFKPSDLPSTKKSSNGHFRGKKSGNNLIKNNPYPESGHLQARSPAADGESVNGHLSFSVPSTRRNASNSSFPLSENTREDMTNSNKSAAPTVATNSETINSDAGQSRAFTTKTGGGLSSMDGVGGANSTFSSPNQSQQSLTTTLTTIQSTSPANALNQPGVSPPTSGQQGNGSLAPSTIQFSHQYPVSSSPASAIPPHLAPSGPPTTYSSATANNLLTDDASILTLASSSKRRRRRSMDTDASVRALAPSSVWGGSRESLPLSVLSGNVEHATSTLHAPSRPSIGGVASTERASVYSSHSQNVGAPALASERNSYYATSHKQANKDKDGDSRSIAGRSMHRDTEDGKSIHGGKSLYGGESLRGYEGSIRSGALGHGRSDSLPGSIASPLASPGVSRALGASSRRSSDIRYDAEEQGDEEDKV